MGFNAEVRQICNLSTDGVLDATKIVVRTLQIAFAHARTVLQTGAWDISEPALQMREMHVGSNES